MASPKRQEKPKSPRKKRVTKTELVEVYDSMQARSTTTAMKASRAARDIAPRPEIVDRPRRDAAFASLRIFLETYFPQTFRLAWSQDHRRIIDRLQAVIEGGGQYAVAAPRGGGKTSMTERAALWAVVTGRRRYVVYVACNESLAEKALERLKAELERNDLLLADWPNAAYPIRRLEGQSRRCVGQLFDGVRTSIVWQRRRLILPTMPPPDAESSGAVIHVVGLGGAVRGLNHVDPAGETVRPDLLLIDDPQDRESARSAIQTSVRLDTLNGDLLALGGPKKRVAALATVTKICRDDLADQLLDPKRFPAWQGETYKLVYRWPDRIDFWEEYLKLRAEGFLPGGDRGEGATEFYRRHRAAMDEGAEVAWPERYGANEHSAIQNAFNLRQDLKDAVFEAEFQNSVPEPPKDAHALDAVEIAQRVNGSERFVSPPEVERLTCFIDVGPSLLWYMVCGWSERFDCAVLDAGAWPEQRARVFATRNADPTIVTEFGGPEGGLDGAIYGALESLVGEILGRAWTRSDGAEMPVSRILIDSGFERNAVRLFARQSEHRERLQITKGFGVGPGERAIADYTKREGERIGDGWILGTAGPDRLRLLRFDTNHAKSRVAGMLTRRMGDHPSVTLWGDRPIEHELLALHLSAERGYRKDAKGQSVVVWERLADRENHLFDCLVGNTVAATFEGLSPMRGLVVEKKPRQRVSFAELQRQAQERRAQGGDLRTGWAGRREGSQR